MPPVNFAAALLALCAAAGAAPARAEPARAALVIGNATYGSLPGLSACARAGNVVAAALRARGFEVTKREDASTGAIDAAIGEFTQRLAAGPSVGFVYVCGYAAAFNDRLFLLPVTANLARPSDALTQGVLAKTLLNALGREGVAAAVAAFDLIPKPGDPPAGAAALATLTAGEGVGLAVVAEPPRGDAPTPLATALAAALAEPALRSDTLLDGVQARLTAGAAVVAALRPPARPGFLAGEPPMPAPPPVVPPAAQVPAAPAPAAQAPAAQAPAAPPAPVAALPDETQMTEADRRTVQNALIRLGYYTQTADGRFGPETRAAIRRYQHEIGTEMTGRLTGPQATRLVGTR